MSVATDSKTMGKEIQFWKERLKEQVERDKVFEETDGELTYDGVNKIDYLDMIINSKK